MLDRGDAIILFLLFTIFVYFMVRDIVYEKGDPVFTEAASFSVSTKRPGLVLNLMWVASGMALLMFGGTLTIEQGATIATLLELPPVVVGIFLVAVGTSLPELVTSAIAAYKKETDLALGNIVGSNIFNSLVVLPAAGIIEPLPIPAGGDVDLAVGFAVVLVVITMFLVYGGRIGRVAGAVIVVSYFAYMAFRVTS
jgi:cation:H+ antiporter